MNPTTSEDLKIKIENLVKEIISSHFDKPLNEIKDNTDLALEFDADSVDIVSIITKIETEINTNSISQKGIFKFPMEEVTKIKNVTDIMLLILSHL